MNDLDVFFTGFISGLFIMAIILTIVYNNNHIRIKNTEMIINNPEYTIDTVKTIKSNGTTITYEIIKNY